MNETDPPVPGSPILYRPETFDRHSDAVRYVERLIQTRAPFPGSGRFADSKPGAWGLLASGGTISSGSGLTLGSGTVTLCTLEGYVLTDTGVSVTVYNSGAPITASYGGKVVALEWTEAGWSACECGIPGCSGADCYCGSECTGLCGGVHLVPTGSVTDDNGTWPISYSSAFNWWWTAPIPKAGLKTLTYTPGTFPTGCTYGTGTGYYGYIFTCNFFALYTTAFNIACFVFPDFVTFFGYSTNPADIHWGSFASQWNANEANSFSCGADAVTIAHTFSPQTIAGQTLSPPVSTATATVKFEPAAHRLCCFPCGLPKKGLTLSIGATMTTLAYDAGSESWTDGTHTLSCTDLLATLLGGGTWTIGTDNTCAPLHLVFTSGGTTAYVDE